MAILAIMRNSHRSHKVNLLFIGGTGRSGTTIVGDLLDSHQSIIKSSPTELKFIANPQGLLDVLFGPRTYPEKPEPHVSPIHIRTYRRQKVRALEKFLERCEKMEERFWSQWWEIDAPEPLGPGLIANYSRAEVEETFAKFKKGGSKPKKAGKQLIDWIISKRIAGGGYRYWVETTPLNISSAHRLLALYPDAKFINMVRDPRDVISSLLTKNWGPNTPEEGITWIDKRLREDHYALAQIPSGQLLTIQMEELVQGSREASYQKMLDFLDLPDDSSMREFFATKVLADSASIGRWREKLDTPEFLAAFTQLQQELKRDSIAINTYEQGK